MALTIKISFGDDNRRVTLDSTPNYESLLTQLDQLFPFLNRKFIIKYVDTDNDLITLSSDQELIEAISILGGSTPVLRLKLYPLNAPATPFQETAFTTSETPKSENPNVNNNANTPPFNLNNLLNPQLFSTLAQTFSQPQSTARSNTTPGLSQASQPGISPFILQLLSNPQMIQMATQFLPMIISAYQNASPDQKQYYQQLIQNLASNPQLQSPQLQPFLQTLQTLTSSQQSQAQSAPVSPFTNFAQAFANQNFASAASSASSTSNAAYTCNICDNIITGVRSHCNQCDNYDLCSYCKDIPEIHEASHTWTDFRPSN